MKTERNIELVSKAIDAFDHEDQIVDPETTIGDLLADLMHWCDAYGVDFNVALKRGQRRYEAETESEA
jgi:hypothetical protein